MVQVSLRHYRLATELCLIPLGHAIFMLQACITAEKLSQGFLNPAKAVGQK